MRLIEARNKMHHGTFNSEGQFVDKDGNPIELKTSSFDPSDLDTIKDILDKARDWAKEHGVNPPPSFDPFNMDGNGDASGSSSSNNSDSSSSGSGESSNSSDVSSNNNNSSNSQNGSQGNSQGQSSDSGDPSGAGGDEGDASDSGNNDSQNQSQGNSGDSSNNSSNSSGGSGENKHEKIPPDPKKTYVDIRNNKHYKWDGTKFVEVPA
mgnify:CR=1 FL=1